MIVWEAWGAFEPEVFDPWRFWPEGAPSFVPLRIRGQWCEFHLGEPNYPRPLVLDCPALLTLARGWPWRRYVDLEREG